MDDFSYPLSLALIAILAIIFYRNNSSLLMLLIISLGAYIIYSHETGYTATNFKDEFIETIDESVGEYGKSHGIDSFEDEELEEDIK